MVNSHSLPETKSKFAPENGWLEDEVSFGDVIFSRAVFVLGRVAECT